MHVSPLGNSFSLQKALLSTDIKVIFLSISYQFLWH